jgi:GcrA cell cycle regulator
MRNACCFDWTDSAVARLKELWGEGFSASECGKRMGVSRNSVIGKIHRLGLSGKFRRPRERARRMTRPKRDAVSKRRDLLDVQTPQKSVTSPERCDAPIGKRDLSEEPHRGSFDLLDLKLGQCRYPEGNGPPFAFCGAPIVDGYPYCLEHAELCYNKPVAVRVAA